MLQTEIMKRLARIENMLLYIINDKKKNGLTREYFDIGVVQQGNTTTATSIETDSWAQAMVRGGRK